jgi:superfamily II DNA or RNA helicase
MRDADMPLLILVIVPLSDLVKQWRDRARRFGFQPLQWDGSTSQAERTAVKDAFRRADHGRTGAYEAMVITTADSLTGALQSVVESFRGTILVIGDEMHSLGTQRRLRALPSAPRFTIGLSATPKRHRDDEGTEELLAYFGPPLVSISISQAIHDLKALCPYRYHVACVQLSADEAAEFRRLSKLIAAAMGANRDADAHIRARSNLLAHAEGKFAVLADLMTGSWSYQTQEHQLIYVGEGGPRGGEPSVSRVTSYLGNTLGMKVSAYVAATPSEDRDRLQRELGSGEIQALVAMKCLDEGVDIPEARVGIMLASTQNPRQFVQRRGRILRRSDNKVVADIHDVLVVPPDGHELLDSDRTLLGNELSRAFELADAALNRTDAIHSIRTMAIAAGLFDEDYPWMQDLDSPLEEWTASQ